MADVLTRLQSALADRYRIERELGAGGMATVFQAQDLRHDRQVAIKVLRPELAAVIGADRFLREIKTIASLQHPHILGLIDSGEVNGTAYYVMPFVEGESLRDRLIREKQLPIADAVRIATEVASALDYAHRHQVIHRDIKPENILIHDGQALVADFGIALAVSTAGGTRMTETGMSLGTPHYMSPEQAMGEREITARADIYALGAMTYEMLIGEPPFTGPTAQAIIAKVMTTEPVALTSQRRSIPAGVESAVLTALEKLPADRFASAAAFAEALSGERQGSARPMARQTAAWSRGRRIAVGVTGLLLLAAAFVAGRTAGLGAGTQHLSFEQRTFHEQGIYTARFAPDGKTLIYSAMVDSASPQLYVIRHDYAEPTPLGITDAHLLSVSSKSELAVLVRPQYKLHRVFQGTLARVPIGGGAPREILDSVREADWSPNGSEMEIIHEVKGQDRLEFPIGTVLYQAAGYLSEARVSPDGKHIAFAEHPWKWDDRGTVKIVDLAGKVVVVTREFPSIEGLAWRPNGGGLFFSAWGSTSLIVHSLGLGGDLREAVSGTGDLTTQDVGPTGQLLVTRDDAPYRLMLHAPGATGEQDVSWLNNSFLPTLSADGSLLAFANGGADAGSNYEVMLLKTNGGKVARLGEGGAAGFSPDGKSLLAIVPSTPAAVVIYPTGAGSERHVDVGAFESIGSADWFPDGQSILVCGNRKGEASRCFSQALSGGVSRAVTPAGTGSGLVSPDGRELVAFGATVGHRRYPISGGAGVAIAGLTASEWVVRWTTDGRALIVGSTSSHRVERLDLATGRREPVLLLGTDRIGAWSWVNSVTVSDNLRSYAYVGVPFLSQLYTVDGVR